MDKAKLGEGHTHSTHTVIKTNDFDTRQLEISKAIIFLFQFYVAC